MNTWCIFITATCLQLLPDLFLNSCSLPLQLLLLQIPLSTSSRLPSVCPHECETPLTTSTWATYLQACPWSKRTLPPSAARTLFGRAVWIGSTMFLPTSPPPFCFFHSIVKIANSSCFLLFIFLRLALHLAGGAFGTMPPYAPTS